MYKLRYKFMEYVNYDGRRVQMLRAAYLKRNSKKASRQSVEALERFLAYLDGGAR